MNDDDKHEIRETMREVLRDEFKGLFLEAFEPFATSIQQEFIRINQRFDRLEERVARLEERVGRLETQGAQVLRRLDNIDSQISDLRIAVREWRGEGEVEVLKLRIAELEARVAALEASLRS